MIVPSTGRKPEFGLSVNTHKRVDTGYPHAGRIAGMASIGENIRKRREELGWSQERLAKESGTSQTTIQAIEKNPDRGSKHLPRIAAALGMSVAQIDESLGMAEPGPIVIPRADLVADRDLPVFASVEGGHGQVILHTDPVDFVRRPTHLLHVKDGYGVIIDGTSMVPAYRPGDVALVNPRIAPRPDDAVVLYTGEEAGGERRATIKEYRSATEEMWRLRRYQPKEEDFTLKKKDWPICHTVVGRYSRR